MGGGEAERGVIGKLELLGGFRGSECVTRRKKLGEMASVADM